LARKSPVLFSPLNHGREPSKKEKPMARKMEDISDFEGTDFSAEEFLRIKDIFDRKSFHIEDFSVVVERGRIGDKYDDKYDDIRKKEDLNCRERSTLVFWNVIKCPIPPDVLPGVESTIRSALRRMGLHGTLLIYAYGDKSLLDRKDVFLKAGISYHVEREQLSDADIEDSGEMALHVILLADNTIERPAALMAIPKPDQDSELHRVLKCLQSRDHDVLLVDPPVGDSGGQFLESAESVLACIQGLDGEAEPIAKPKCVCAYS
jgi:hypothetical protein